MCSYNPPLVSIVIPCYNHEKYIKQCISSIVDQDYSNIELIIIDDGSKDRSIEKIKEMQAICERRFFRYELRTRGNRGISATLNEGIDWCEGEFVSPLASDDVLYPNKISKQVSEFFKRKGSQHDLVAIYSGVEFIDEHSRSLRCKKGSGKYCGFKEVILRTEFLPTPTFFVDRKKLLNVGGFNPSYKIEDFYIRLKLTDSGGIFYIMPDVLVKYRRHDDNFSKKSNDIWNGVQEILSDYRDRDIYNKALAMSMMVQAHDFQTVSTKQGIKFLLRAVRQWPGVLFSMSMVRFCVKAIM